LRGERPFDEEAASSFLEPAPEPTGFEGEFLESFWHPRSRKPTLTEANTGVNVGADAGANQGANAAVHGPLNAAAQEETTTPAKTQTQQTTQATQTTRKTA